MFERNLRDSLNPKAYRYFTKDITYIFSDRVDYGNGQKIADYIREHELGYLTESHATVNPNSGGLIKVFVWTWNGKLPPHLKKAMEEAPRGKKQVA